MLQVSRGLQYPFHLILAQHIGELFFLFRAVDQFRIQLSVLLFGEKQLNGIDNLALERLRIAPGQHKFLLETLQIRMGHLSWRFSIQKTEEPL